MQQSGRSLTTALVASVMGLILAAAVLGMVLSQPEARVAWTLLALLAVASLLLPYRWTGGALALLGAGVFLMLFAMRWRLQHALLGDVQVGAGALGAGVLVMIGAPLLLQWLRHERDRVQRRVHYQTAVIDDLASQSPDTGTKDLDTLLATEVDRARRYQRPLSLAIVAVDEWEAVAATQGEVGAVLLRDRIVAQLAAGVRTVDKVVSLSDGTFALLLPETPLEGAQLLVTRLQATTSAAVQVLLRVGLANFPEDGVTKETLLGEAREALTFARAAELLVVDRSLLV